MTAAAAWAVLCGVALGVGAWSILASIPRLGRPRLADRVAPYLVDVSDQARSWVRRRSADPLPVLGTFLAPFLAALRRSFSTALGGSTTIRTRLRQAGSEVSLEQYRTWQLTWGCLGLAAGIGVAILAAPLHSLPLAAQAVVPVLGAVIGFMLRDWLLNRAARNRLRRICAEFPSILEFLTLSLSAGEGIFDSLRRVSRISSGELSKEIGRAVAEVSTGVPLVEALRRLADGLRLPILTRFADAVVGALERGTPLAEVLRAQSQDSRDQTKRALLETAGKKEVAMLVPLVFLILPCTVLFAIFPGIFVLQSGF
ncbi:MAG: type II secretion system F family protein [Microbacteriaceae bacterium]